MQFETIPGSVGDAVHMNVSLTPELEQYVNGKVRSGLYHSASEVVRAGLRLLKEKDEIHQKKLQELRREIQIGIDQAERGQVSAVSKQTLVEIKAGGSKRPTRSRKAKRRS
jgi:antitoxin ParD1/3/4